MTPRLQKSTPKVKLKQKKKVDKKVIFNVIDEPIFWIRDIQKCKLINKTVLKRSKEISGKESFETNPGKYENDFKNDITQKLENLENFINNKSRKRSSSSSKASSSKKLSFSNVSVFYFNRTLGQSSVPTDGYHPLGMTMKHVDYEKMKVSMYNSNTENSNINIKNLQEHKLSQKGGKSTRSNTISSFSSLSSKTTFSSNTSSSRVSLNRNISKVKDGLFQQMCSSPGPKKMFSSSGLTRLRQSPAFRVSIPQSYPDSGDKFPWRPVPELPLTPNTRLRSSRSKGLASAFSQQLHVQEILQSLPKPEKHLLRELSENCLNSYNNYHQTQMQTDFIDTTSDTLHSPSAKLFSSKRNLRSRKRKIEETGTRGMKVLSLRDRMTLLRPYGVPQFDKTDCDELVEIQTSRENGGGCNCRDGCQPSTCSCHANNITCHVEFAGFPCTCMTTCANPMGRKVFDHVAVALHFINTMFNVDGVMKISQSSEEDSLYNSNKKKPRK